MRIERDTNDGSLIELRDFNNNTVGSLGTSGGSVNYLGSGGSGITITSAGNVGIGGSPSRKLHIIDSGDTYVAVQAGTSSKAGIFFGDSDNHTLSRIRHDNTDNSLQFSTNEIERMRISGGNLLVGTTDTSLFNNTSGGGFSVASSGQTQIAKQGGDSADPVLMLNQTGLDGEILRFYKDGTTVGNIGGSVGSYGYMHLGSGATGLQFTNAFNQVVPYNPSSLSVRDNTIDLGSSSARFNNLYLSGGVYLGGTGSANKLDDYEEGSWTPSVSSASTTHGAVGLYTRVGNIVSIQASIHFTQSGTTFGSISGLPFAVSSINYTPITFREWYSTGVPLFGNFVIGSQSTTTFKNASNSSAANNGQQYGYAIQAVYRV
jgi:hypothetical protein